MIRDVRTRKLFGCRLNQVMGELDVTDEQLAEALGLRRETVLRWRCGATTPGVDALIGIRNELGVSIDWLLLGEGKKDAT